MTPGAFENPATPTTVRQSKTPELTGRILQRVVEGDAHAGRRAVWGDCVSEAARRAACPFTDISALACSISRRPCRTLRSRGRFDAAAAPRPPASPTTYKMHKNRARLAPQDSRTLVRPVLNLRGARLASPSRTRGGLAAQLEGTGRQNTPNRRCCS
jgi:hypothetical protein